MRVGIVTTGPKTYSIRRLKEAVIKRGHTVKALTTLDFSIYVEENRPVLFYKGKPLTALDAIIPRIGASTTQFGLSVVRQFEQMGVFTLTGSNAIAKARDKLRTMQMLSKHDIGIPPSAYVHRKEDILPAIEQVGGAPVIIKLLNGTQGVGVMLVETEKSAEAIVETLQLAGKYVLIQKFVSESKGKDIRALVVGGRLIAAMRRIAEGVEFRSNLHRGGASEAVTLDEEYEKTAIRSADILGLGVAGVDMLESSEGPQVAEVNSSPGLEGIERSTGIDVADAIVAYLEEQVQFPDVDITERIPLSKGFGVAEVPIARKSAMAHRTIAETQLRQEGIQILNVMRNGGSIPNPHESFELLPDDTLLCFGKFATLKAIIPSKVKPARRKR